MLALHLPHPRQKAQPARTVASTREGGARLRKHDGTRAPFDRLRAAKCDKAIRQRDLWFFW
jgi:hypothetical protein